MPKQPDPRTVVGVTGTRWGMTEAQYDSFLEFMLGLPQPIDLHHGDCVGVDEQAHWMVVENVPRHKIFVHPPVSDALRAFCPAWTVHEPKPYKKRDKDIVEVCEVLVAAPGGMVEEVRSGTWYTVRLARRAGRRVYLIMPNGEIREE